MLIPACIAVETFTSASLDEKVNEGKEVFVKFYSPSCPHCTRMQSAWEELKSSKVQVGQVDCTQNTDACKRFGVRGVPSLALVSGGKLYRYSGQRDVASMQAFMDGGYLSTAAESAPGPAMPSTITSSALEAISEIARQLTAIFSYSPISCAIIFLFGLFFGASLTGLIAINASKRGIDACDTHTHQDTELKTVECSNEKSVEEKKVD